MKLIKRFPLTACLFALALGMASPQATAADDAAKMKWFNDSRAGMFIHWGPYAITGCEWKGQSGKRDAHMMNEFRIPLAEYRQLASTFNPVQFDAAKWVKIAKEAGLGYIIYVSKHHDGFAMFNSPSSDFDIPSVSHFTRDPLKELADECRKQGIVLCIYYSLGRDWSVPGVPKGGKRCNDWDFPEPPPDAQKTYIQSKVKPQLKELLTQYGPIGAIWFDTPDQITKEHSAEIRDYIHSLQPNCLINARIGNNMGDYDIFEQKIPKEAIRRPWETCLTINDRWGFDKNNHKWKSSEMIVRCLVDVASKGGNFVVNVGPTGEGVIPEPSVERLMALGDWLKVNGEAIYGTTASRFAATDSGVVFQEINPDGSEAKLTQQGSAVSHDAALPHGWRSTTKPDAFYIHLFDRPANGVVKLTGVPEQILGATLLADPQHRALKVLQQGEELSVTLPDGVWDSRATVLKLAIAPKK